MYRPVETPANIGPVYEENNCDGQTRGYEELSKFSATHMFSYNEIKQKS